jgi:hypothetical protein
VTLVVLLLACGVEPVPPAPTPTPAASPTQPEAPARRERPSEPLHDIDGDGFVACPSWEMVMGALPPADPYLQRVRNPRSMKGSLVYYGSAVGVGLLAPPGLHCEAGAGSDGVTLTLRRVADGPVVATVDRNSVDTSGRWDAVRAYGRHFPEREAYIQDVIDADVGVTRVDRGAFPEEILERPARGVVRFRTPPGATGSASLTQVAPSDGPSFGAIVDQYADEGHLSILAVSLGADLPLTAAQEDVVVRQFLRDIGPARPLRYTPAERAAIARAESAATRLADTLRTRLTRALETGTPASAVEVCTRDAPRVVATLARGNTRVGRASLRLRNPENAGPAWVSDWLTHRADHPPDEAYAVTRIVDGEARVLRPIRVEAPCLACHGDATTVAPDVRAALRARYPADEAAGYALGDLRGAVWASSPVNSR